MNKPSEFLLAGTLPPPIDQLPADYRRNIEQAVKLLKESGCTEVYLFGSLAAGAPSAQSDIDLAVRGCSPQQFFALLGRLLMDLEHPVDLVDLDSDDPLAHFLIEKDRLRRIA